MSMVRSSSQRKYGLPLASTKRSGGVGASRDMQRLARVRGGGGGSRTRVRRWIRTSFYACRHAVRGLALAGGGRPASATSQRDLGLRVLAGQEAQPGCVGALRL